MVFADQVPGGLLDGLGGLGGVDGGGEDEAPVEGGGGAEGGRRAFGEAAHGGFDLVADVAGEEAGRAGRGVAVCGMTL